MTTANQLVQRKRIDWTPIRITLGPLIGLVFVVILFAVLRPATFLAVDNFQIMLMQTAVVATGALGMTLIIISGGIDLSIGSNIAFCTVAVALMLANGVPPILAAIGGVLISATWGVVIGTLITRLNLAPFIITLGMWGALRGAAKGLANKQIVPAPPTWLNNLLQSLGPENNWSGICWRRWGVAVMTVVANGCTKIDLPNWFRRL